MSTTVIELGVATATSTGVALAVNAEPLLTVLIAFGTSFVTMVGGELIKFLVAWLKNKREKIEKESEDTTDVNK